MAFTTVPRGRAISSWIPPWVWYNTDGKDRTTGMFAGLSIDAWKIKKFIKSLLLIFYCVKDVLKVIKKLKKYFLEKIELFCY